MTETSATTGAPPLDSQDYQLTSAFVDEDYGADDKTLGFFQQRINCEPVVGWLVAIAGPEKGRDYRLHSGRNFIGRDFDNDVVLVDDPRISRQNHCSVIFEPKQAAFFIAPGAGLPSLGGREVSRAEPLLVDQPLVIGNTTLVLASFCGPGKFSWDPDASLASAADHRQRQAIKTSQASVSASGLSADKPQSNLETAGEAAAPNA